MSPFLIAESTATTTTTTGGSGGGGGGSTEIEIMRILRMDLIAPNKLTIYHDDTVSTPILLENSGDYDLTNVRLSAESNTEFLTPTLDTTRIGSLDSGDMKSIMLYVRADSDPGQYAITVTAESEDPQLKETTRIYMDLSDKYGQDRDEANNKLNFAEKLFDDNPECLELKELLQQATKEIDADRFHKAQTLIKGATDACRSLINIREETKTRKSAAEPTTGMAWLNNLMNYKKRENIVVYAIILIVIIALTSILFRRKNSKPKTRRVKKSPPPKRRAKPKVNRREQFYS